MSDAMNETIKLIISLSISGGLFTLVLFALKPLMRNRLSKSFQYYIWLVVLIRFILPFSFGINLMDFTLNAPNEPQVVEETVIPNNPVNLANFNSVVNNAVNNNEPIIAGQQSPTSVTPDSMKPFDVAKTLADNLMWIWLAGVVISAAWNILGYLRFIRYVHGAAYAIEMSDCDARLYKSRFAPTPMLVGVISPRIYLPDTPYTDGELDNILLHELTHLRRRDVWLKWFVSLVVSAHWFNPIAYLMRREFNRACELSCDEAVICKLDGAAKQSYGDTLISVVAESRTPIGVMSVTMCEEKKKLKERLTAIMNYKKKTKIAVLITAVLAVVITGSALVFGASFGANDRDLIEMEVIYSNVTEYSHSMQVKWGERTYSSSTDYQDGFKVGKQIGFIRDENGYKYKIYECEGLSTDRYLVAYYDVIMSTYDLFAADANYLTLAEVEKMNGQPQSTVRKHLGEANGVLSGFWGEIYELADGRQAILYYGSDSCVENIVVNTNEVQGVDYDISFADLRQLAAKGDELVFEDFVGYEWRDVGFGLFILHFKIEGGYTLLVGGGSLTGKPMYATLQILGAEESIDIRYDDIDEFISKDTVLNDINALTPRIILHEYDDNPDLALGKALTKEEKTGWVRLTGMVFIEVKVPDGAMTVKTYYAETGTEATAHQMFGSKYSAPHKNPPVPNEHPTGNSFNVADYYPNGFLGHIWAVITDADGVEHSSESIIVIYEPDERSINISMEEHSVTRNEEIETISKVTSNIETVNIINTENISIFAENCNIKMDISLDGNLRYDYDNSLFEVKTNTDGSTVIITAKLKANAKAGLLDMITLYIPDQKYNSVTVDSKLAGITIPPLNTNINVTNDKGAVGIRLPNNFNKTVNYTATNASGAIDFDKDIINFTLKMSVQNSSVSIAKDFPQYKNGSNYYEYKNGDGYAMINIDVKDTSFAIRTDQ